MTATDATRSRSASVPSGSHMDLQDSNMLQMHLVQDFDARLNYKLKVRQDDEKAHKNYLIHRRYLSRIKYFVIFLYIGVMPFIETPYWCLQKNGDHPIQKTLIYDCHVDMADYEVKYSSFANFNPILTYSLDICCVVFLVYFKWFKSLWSVQTSQDKLRNYLFNALAIISILIFAVTMWLR